MKETTVGKWDLYGIKQAHLAASMSKDPSTKVGAAIFDDKKRVVSTGYNGPPRGTEDSIADRETKLRRTLHAELNAILFAQRDLAGCTIYVTHHPCAQCAAVIVQSGIESVVAPRPSNDAFSHRWTDDIREAQAIFKEAGVRLRLYE